MVRPRESSAGDVDYERLSVDYASLRQPDPRIEQHVRAALGDAGTVLNVGAGAGSYEPEDRLVLAVEPSAKMRASRPRRGLPALDATAQDLPFDDDAFDAAMAIITVHQWDDVAAGLRELRRVAAGPVLVMTFDREQLNRLWLGEYVPQLFEHDRARLPAISLIEQVLGGAVDVVEVPVPLDCRDGFAEAYYGRPEAFLRPEVRAAQSVWQFVDEEAAEAGLSRLAEDLADGRWDQRHGHLRSQPEFVGSLRLVISRPTADGRTEQR
jgi:hypothetical protein